jgi:NADPH-dependent 2,4-dienoyl-CoA reductase/sulfur reductase-like enzyme
MPQVLPRIIDAPFAAMLQNHMKNHGVHIYTGEGALSIEADDKGPFFPHRYQQGRRH